MAELKSALAISREIEDRRMQAGILVNTVHLHICKNDLDTAIAAAELAREIFRDLDDKSAEARAVYELHSISVAKKEFKMAAQLSQERRPLLQEDGDKRTEAQALLDLACDLANDGKGQEAMNAATDAQETFM